MDRSSYLRLADETLERVTTWLEEFDPDDVDFSAADGVLTIEFADGGRYVLNRQTAASQMWFAAGASAWHYDWESASESWRCDKDGHELYARVSEEVSAKLGRSVAIP